MRQTVQKVGEAGGLEYKMVYGRWNIAGYDRQRAVELTRSGINPLVAVVLSSRGIDDNNVKRLTGEEDPEIYDPFLLKDMDRAADRIKLALKNGENIAVYGDYDVDGITSSCLLTDYLRSRGADCTLYIPERLEDGYGVRDYTLKALKESGVDLVVTVDCGMTACAEVDYAKSIGLDMVITDHHECGERLPDAPAVNPKRCDSLYPEKSLAGVGVAFKLICAIEGIENTDKMLDRYGDLVAIGTIADVMDVTGENRTFIKKGIELIKAGHRPGITALCAAVGVEPAQVTVNTVGFVIAPRINAAGRIGNTDTAVDLVLERDPEKAERLALELCMLNKKRQELECEMFNEAVAMAGNAADSGGPIVISSEGWHQGIAGIVASRLAEKYCRPAIVICLKGGEGRGSCRSFGGFELFDAIEYAGDYLKNYGGHKAAAGITIEEDKIPAFREKLSEYYFAHTGEGENTVYNVDFEVVKPGLLTEKNVDALKSLEPYGNGNPTPLLCILGAEAEGVTALSGGKHVKFKAKKNGECFECVFFGKSPEDVGVQAGDIVDIAFMPQINDYRGRRTVQLLMTDIYIHENSKKKEV